MAKEIIELRSKHCGRWVFTRPKISDWMVYLVRTPEGHIKRDYGTGQANAFGEIVAWLEMYPEPPYPPNAGTQRGRDAEATNATETRTRTSLK